ncbi:MAG: MATE family efflux transporter [Butyrivibrio sp.]|uniref:MATE family efflux transporter n=1 Tax=Butyrivibrio sp. TaxID=28121 RepID=UPI0025FB0F01|nr:MATE family efflux transporter [Butyrivibrio sp.]MCR5771532.1 MATE family efflux transporter [Butyrivibrio sp.]
MARSKNIDMTKGPILKELVLFALPLLLGNAFQQLYNTVDSVIVGQFVGPESLAAVTSTAVIINTLVGLFVGFSTGSSVIISQFFGAQKADMLRKSIHTALTATFIMGIAFMILGYFITPPLIVLMKTDVSVIEPATTYLRIYFLGILGLMFYNMTSAILRAIGDSVRPLIFLIITSVLNIILDLLFVIGFKMGVSGVAYATVISQFVSAFMGMYVLLKTKENYGISFKEMHIDPGILKKIFSVGLPAGLQMAIISFSNIFVQSYINSFGAASTAGWGSYGRIDAFVMLPLQSISLANTTFTGQNAGARNPDRIKQGIRISLLLAVIVTIIICALEYAAAPYIIRLFTKDQEVMKYGIIFIRCNCMFDFFCCFNQIHAGVLRGIGDATAPMFIMIFSFVIFRQIYLFVITRITPSIYPVSLSFPVGWMMCSLLMLIYFRLSHWEKKLGSA